MTAVIEVETVDFSGFSRSSSTPQLSSSDSTSYFFLSSHSVLKKDDTFFVVGDGLLVEDMVGVVPTLGVGFLVGELAFVEVVEESIIGHDVVGIKRATNCPSWVLTHQCYYY